MKKCPECDEWWDGEYCEECGYEEEEDDDDDESGESEDDGPIAAHGSASACAPGE